MSKRLNITAAEYQHKIRQQAKSRTIKFRQAQEERGYKNISVFLSEPFRAELERLADEKGLNRQDAMDFIFGVYQGNVNISVTSNAILTDDKKAETPVNPGPFETVSDQPAKISEQEPVEAPALVEPAKPIQETQAEITGPMPDRSDKTEYKAWLFSYISALKDSSLSWPEITAELNSNGIFTTTGKPWSKGAVSVFISRNK